MKRHIIILILLLVFKLSFAQELKKEYQEVVRTFIDCIRDNNIDKLKKLIRYPLKRVYPLSNIEDGQEFQRRYDDIFDDSLKSIIIHSDISKDWSEVGWRGIMLNNGTLWLDYDGSIIAINYQSNYERDKGIELIEKDKNIIHESIRDYDEPILIMETDEFRIRIDKLEDGKYRYTSWPIISTMSEKPDLVLKNGIRVSEGSGGNHKFEFVNGNYKYVCAIIILGRVYSPPANLIVYKNGQEIMHKPAQLIRN